jgi:DNA excision repair protein ERCC-4
MESKESHEK